MVPSETESRVISGFVEGKAETDPDVRRKTRFFLRDFGKPR